MITRRVTGSEATQHPKRKRIVHEMGEYAAVINSILTSGYGSDFDWTSNGNKHKTWVDYVVDEFDLENRLQLFAKHKMLTDAVEGIVTHTGGCENATAQGVAE